MLQEELPYYSLCYKTYSFITVKEFTSTETPTFFDMYRGCDTWKWKKVVVTEQKMTNRKIFFYLGVYKVYSLVYNNFAVRNWLTATICGCGGMADAHG